MQTGMLLETHSRKINVAQRPENVYNNRGGVEETTPEKIAIQNLSFGPAHRLYG